MFWIAALAAAAIIGSIARIAWQDHRDAELQRSDALDDVAKPRSWRKQRALPSAERLRLSAGSQVEGLSDVAIQPPVAAPRPADDPTHARRHDARML